MTATGTGDCEPAVLLYAMTSRLNRCNVRVNGEMTAMDKAVMNAVHIRAIGFVPSFCLWLRAMHLLLLVGALVQLMLLLLADNYCCLRILLFTNGIPPHSRAMMIIPKAADNHEVQVPYQVPVYSIIYNYLKYPARPTASTYPEAEDSKQHAAFLSAAVCIRPAHTNAYRPRTSANDVGYRHGENVPICTILGG